MAQPHWGARGLKFGWVEVQYMSRLSAKNYKARATGTLHHLEAFCAVLKTVPYRLNYSTYYTWPRSFGDGPKPLNAFWEIFPSVLVKKCLEVSYYVPPQLGGWNLVYGLSDVYILIIHWVFPWPTTFKKWSNNGPSYDTWVLVTKVDFFSGTL